MCPFGDDEDLAVEDVRDKGVGYAYRIAVLGGGRRRVEVTEGIRGFGFVAALGKIEGRLVIFVIGAFDVEG